MEEMAKHFKAFGFLWLEVAIIAQFFAIQVVFPTLPAQTTQATFFNGLIFFLLANSSLYLLLAGLPLLWFEKAGWKVFHRKVNVAGGWRYAILYYTPNTQYLKKGGQEKLINLLNRLKDNHGEVWFDQTVFGISVQEGAGYLGQGPDALKATWKGTSVSVTKQGNVVVHFSANLGGIKFNGIDDLTVSKRDKKGQPIEMFGHFLMVPDGTDFVLRGEITYYR